jgi:hypothetical protein
MSETARMWIEISFNFTYLIVVWGLVVTMILQRPTLAPENRRQASLVIWAFGLLALGDTGHVGFRVLAYSQGSLESTINLFGRQVGLVGLGALATAVTVTIFYVLMLELWRVRFNKQYGWFEYLLLATAAIRLVLMALPFNDWNAVVPPQPWSIIRNLPLTVLGLGVAYLFLRDGRATQDRAIKWMGAMILVSYACYIPVILLVQQAPMVGMLMIPKTIAYVVIGFIAYFDLYRSKANQTDEMTEDAEKTVFAK